MRAANKLKKRRRVRMKFSSRIALALLLSLLAVSEIPFLSSSTFLSPVYAQTTVAGISLTKTPSATNVVSGSPVSFLYNATNTGDTALTGAIYDDVFGPVGSFVNLQPGGWVGYNITHVLTESVFNTALAYGVDDFGQNVTDSASAFVQVRVPAISVEKTCSPEEQLAPGTITWNITVTNTGATSLTAVNVTDTRHGYLGSIGALNPGQTIFFVIVETGLPPDTYCDSATAVGAYEFGTVSDFDEASCVVKPVYVRKEFTEVGVLSEGKAAGFDATLVSPTQVTVHGLKSGPYVYFNVTYYFENSLNFLGDSFDGQAHSFTLWDKWGGNLLALGSKPASFNPTKNGPDANKLTLEDGSLFRIDAKLAGPDSYRDYIGEGLDITNLASQGEAWITMHLGDQQGGTNPGKGKASIKDGKSYDTDVVWQIGELGVDESATLSLILAPGKNPGGQLQFSSPGCMVINTGPVVRACSAAYEDFLYAVEGNSLTVNVVR